MSRWTISLLAGFSLIAFGPGSFASAEQTLGLVNPASTTYETTHAAVWQDYGSAAADDTAASCDGGCETSACCDSGGGCHDACATCCGSDPCMCGKAHGYCLCKRCLDSTCDLYPHYPYFPAMHGYYYFRPYHHSHIPRHQALVSGWGGDPRNPYANQIFEKVYAQYQAETGQGVAAPQPLNP